MIPILYETTEEALGGVWVEKKGSYQTHNYWNSETSAAVLTSTTSNYTAWSPISVTPGKIYHYKGTKGTSSKQDPVLFVTANNTIIKKVQSPTIRADLKVMAPANSVYALITTGSVASSNLNNTSFRELDQSAAPTNGIGRLADCTRCAVTEERNGKYECEFDYPVTGIHYEEIQNGRVIAITHDEQGDTQPFIIYRKSAPFEGMVTFYAHHVSYELINVIAKPFTASSIADAFDQLESKTYNTNNFTLWTDSSSSGDFKVEVPSSIRSILGGQEGSILDIYGGEYEFDGLVVKNYVSRGHDTGVTIRYGKNLSDITDTLDISESYNAVVPYWKNDKTLVVGGIVSQSGAETIRLSVTDLSNEFDEAPTSAQLETAAAAYLSSHQPWTANRNIKIDFVALWQTEEYKGIANLERVRLCDTVHVIYPQFDIDVSSKVVKVVWDALTERYSSIELGEAKSTFGDTVVSGAMKNELKDVAKTSVMMEAINHATQLISGGLGGYIVFTLNANGEPTEMLIMNTPDIETATRVMRFNNEGIGYSTTGYQGPFTSAWTLSDGAFVADFITAGHLSCNRIQGGTLSLGGDSDGNGVLKVYDASNNEIGSWTGTGITLNRGKLTSADGNTYFDLTNSELRCSSIFSPEPSGVEQATAAVFKGTSTGSGRTSNFVMYSELGGVNRGIKFIPPILGTDLAKINSPNGLYLYQGSKYMAIGAAPAGDQQAQSVGMGITSGGRVWADSSGAGIEGESISGFGAYFVAADDTGIRMNSNILWDDSGTYLIGFRSGSNYLCRVSKSAVSSRRYKHSISEVKEESIAPERLYEAGVKQFIFNEDYAPEGSERHGKTLIGFIAEELDEVYPIAVNHDKEGQATSWEPAYVVPPMLALIQEQKKAIDNHEARIKDLEDQIDRLSEALERDG